LRNQKNRQTSTRRITNLLNKNLGKIGLGLGISSLLVIGLLAGCGGTTTVTTTVGGSGSTTTVTTTVGGGGGGVNSIVMYGDIVSNIGCLNTSKVHRGELVIFRARIVDPNTGLDMTADDIDSGTVVLPDGQRFKMSYGGHGGNPPADSFWSYAWEVPLNYPTGSLGYAFEAVAKDGRAGHFAPFSIESSTMAVEEFDVAYVRNWSVNITATGFSTGSVTATQGAAVTFSNKDTIPHKVTGDGWTSGDIAAGGSYKKVFDQAGTFVVTEGGNSVTITINAP